jgi:signal transduction histidine kinase
MQVEARMVRIVREHPGWVDVAVVGFALFCSLASSWYVAELVDLPWVPLLNGAPALVLIWRRRAARQVLAGILGIGVVQWVLAVPINGAQISTLIAVYGVARYESGPRARIALGAALALLAIAPFRQPYTGVGNMIGSSLLLLMVHLIGTNVGLRQHYLRALEERAERLERERDTAAEAAAVLERTRIARELHDVVAHHVSVMVVQAEGAGWALDERPEQTRSALAAIAQTGRSTLIELRRLLGVLRSDDQDGMAPQPGLANLPMLIEGFRGSGLSIVSSSEPDRSLTLSLPESLQLATFRIVQEALTNVLKHAGPAAKATVEVRVHRPADGPPMLVVQIQDDGVGLAGCEARAGHGLVGIRERVGIFDGEAEIGPASTGGFLVRATMPLPSEARVNA